MDALVWSDDAKLLAELIGKARGLGGKVHAADLGDGADAPGADTLYKAALTAAQRADGACVAAALKRIAQKAGVGLVLLGGNKRGKAVAAQVAGALDWDFSPEVHDLGVDDGRLWTQRLVLSGQSVAKVRFAGKLVATATSKTFEPAPVGAQPRAEEVAVELPEPRIQVLGTVGAEGGEFNLSEADIVVGVGRGFKKEEDLKLAEELAAALGGAVGCSRPIAADLKWLGEEHWIGLSGHEIKPSLYLAVGVSGQIQHMAGCRGAKVLAAINTNEDAPIFQQADYGIVGDLYQVVPELIDLIKRQYK